VHSQLRGGGAAIEKMQIAKEFALAASIGFTYQKSHSGNLVVVFPGN
jgi:hypothetical protein